MLTTTLSDSATSDPKALTGTAFPPPPHLQVHHSLHYGDLCLQLLPPRAENGSGDQ